MKLVLTLLFFLSLPTPLLAQESLWKAYIDAGTLAYQRKEYIEAERRLKLARVEAEAFGPHDQRLALTYCKLALVYLNTHHLSEAKASSENALEILKTTNWSETGKTLSLQNAELLGSVAANFLNSEEYDEIERLLNQALKIQRAVLKEYDPSIAPTLQYLAITNWLQSRKAQNDSTKSEMKLSEARNHVSEARTIYERTSDFIDHGTLLQAFRNFAIIDASKAESFLKWALTFREQNDEPEYMDLDLLEALSNLYDNQAKFAESEQQSSRRLDIAERAYGKDDIHLGPVLDELGLVLMSQDKYAEAEPFLKRALFVRDAQHLENRDVAESLNVLAKNYFYLGKYLEAVPLYQRAIAITQKLDEKARTNLRRYNKNYALTLYALGRENEADSLFLDYTKNANDGLVALALYEKAELYRSQTKYELAEPLYVDALNRMKKAQIAPYAHAEALEHFAKLLRQTNRLSDALKIETEAQNIRATATRKN